MGKRPVNKGDFRGKNRFLKMTKGTAKYLEYAKKKIIPRTLEYFSKPGIMSAHPVMAVLTISARVMGKRKPLVPDWQVPWPPEEHDHGEPFTLRQLITRIVLQEVAAFQQRQEAGSVVRILTERQITGGLAKGRVDSGGRELQQKVNPEEAVGTALQAFEDGIYLVILDGEEQRDLNRQVYLQPDSHVVFVRLVLLAGA